MCFFRSRSAGSYRMNKVRRQKLRRALDLATHAVADLRQAASIIEQASDDERDAFENLPEALQESDHFSGMEDTADDLEEAASDLEDIISRISGIIG